MKKQTSLITLSLLLATPALAGGAGAPVTRPASPAACQSIAQIVMSDPQFSTLRTAIEAGGLNQTLMTGQYTVFAPTNAAFAKLPSDTLARVLNDPDLLGSVLLYHVLPGKVSGAQIASLRSAKTAQGANVSISSANGRVRVNNATVTRADVPACNGVIHVIDTVLLPPVLSGTQAAAPAAPAAPTAQAPATPAAPATAFDITRIPALPLSGATVSPGGTSTTTDTATTETATTTTETATTTTETAATDTATGTDTTATGTTETTSDTAAETNTLYDVIVADDRFSTLRDLISDAGLTETLISGEYTLFAPTNEAFAALPADTLAALASNPELLRQVLSYHLVQGRLTPEQLATSTSLNAVAGGALTVSMMGSTQMVGPASVTDTVTTASNGTIYLINQVLLPPGLTIPAPAATTDTASTADTSTTTTGTTDTAATGATATGTTGTATGTATAGTTATGTATTTGNNTVVTLITTDPRFTTLAGLIQQAGLADQLASGEFTIFAPTNEAFAKLPAADLAAITGDPARLRAVLLYHVVQGRQTPEQLAAGTQLTSAEGSNLALSMSGKMVGTANVGEAISTPSNGTVYVIDTVLLPPAR